MTHDVKRVILHDLPLVGNIWKHVSVNNQPNDAASSMDRVYKKWEQQLYSGLDHFGHFGEGAWGNTQWSAHIARGICYPGDFTFSRILLNACMTIEG